MENKITKNFNSTVIGNYLRPIGIAGSIALAVIFGASPVIGQVTTGNQLYVGGSYTGGINMLVNNETLSLGGGSISGSSLNGISLAFVYCIDLFTDVSPSASYNNTTVSNNAFVERPIAGVVQSNNPGNPGNQNAGIIAYLMNTYATQPGVNQAILQAAIWTLALDGVSFTANDILTMTNNPVVGAQSVALNTAYYNASDVALYTAYVGETNTDPLSSILWISPSNDGTTFAQSLIAVAAPEPGTYLMLGSFLGLGALSFARQRRSLA